MAYAPHTNTDVHRHLIANATLVPPLVLGVFVEKSYSKTFEYAERRWPDDQYYPNLPHIVYVGPLGEARLGHVLKTVAHILTDDETLMTWKIKSHRYFDTSWVRQNTQVQGFFATNQGSK